MSRVISHYYSLGGITIPSYSKTILKKGYNAFSETVQQMNQQIIIDEYVMSELWAEWMASKHLQDKPKVSNSRDRMKGDKSKQDTDAEGINGNQTDGSNYYRVGFTRYGSPLRHYGPPPTDVFTYPKFLNHSTKIWSTSAEECANKSSSYSLKYEDDETKVSPDSLNPVQHAETVLGDTPSARSQIGGAIPLEGNEDPDNIDITSTYCLI